MTNMTHLQLLVSLKTSILVEDLRKYCLLYHCLHRLI